MRPRPLLPLLATLLGLLCLTGCGKKGDAVDKLLAQGDSFYAKEDYKSANTLYKKALAGSPDDPRALSRLGRLSYRQGRVLSGYLLLQGTLERIPEDLDLLLVYGLANHSLAKTTEARQIAKKVLERQPTNEEALLLLVETCVTSRDSQEVRRLIEQARGTHPDTSIHHVALGMLHLSAQEMPEAEKEFRRALELDPKSSAAHSHLGSLLLLRGDKDAGLAELKTAAALSPLRSPRRIKYIQHLLTAGNTEEASRELALITEKADDYVPAWLEKMKLDFALGRFAESEAEADKVIALDRANYDAWMQRIAIKLRRDDFDGLIADLQKVEGFYNRSPEVKYQLALAFLHKNEIYSAEQALQQALRMAPNYDEAILLQAEIDLRKNNAPAATQALLKLLKRRPLIGKAYVLLAQAYRASGDPAKALTALQALSEKYPKQPLGPYLTGMTLLEQNRRPEARAAFAQALSIAESYWPAAEMLVELDLVEQHAAAASARVEALLQKFPDAVPPRLLRAKIRLLANDVTGAEDDLLKAIAMDPKTPYPYLLLARMYFNSGRAADSLAKLKVLAQERPAPNVLMQVGTLHEALEEFELARASYEKALELDPKFAPALNNLAMLYNERLGQLDKAGELAKRARDAAPNDALVADTAGWILVRRGQYESALRLLQMAAERLTDDPDVQYHLGMAQYYLGQDDAARLAFRSAQAAAASSRAKQLAADRLAILSIDPAQATPAMRAQLEAALRADANDPAALHRLALIEVRAGQLAEGAAHLEAALKINPRNAAAAGTLVELYFGTLQKPDRAKELAKQAREAAPNDGTLAWNIGRLLLAQGEFTWANAVLQDSARLLPNNPEVNLVLAQSHYSLGRVADAEAELAKIAARPDAPAPAARLTALITAERAPTEADFAEAARVLEREPGHVPALMLSARALEQQKKFEAARAVYLKALAVYPQFFPAMRRLAIIAGDHLGDDKQAAEWSHKVLKLAADDPDANYQLGVVSFRNGEYTEGARYLKQSLRRREDHAETHFFLGMCYAQLKNGPECQTALERALQLKLPPQEASEAARILDLLERRRGQF